MSARFVMLATVGASVLAATGALAQAAPDTRTPAPMVFPGWGYDMAGLDRSVDPGDNFDAFVNGKWRAATPIPAKYPAYGVSQNLKIVADNAVRKIIAESVAAKAPQGQLEQKIADYYLSYLDRPGIDARGMAPAQPYLDQINAAADHRALLSLFAKPEFSSAVGIGVGIDPGQPSRYIATFGMGGMGLPTRDNYLVDNPRNIEMRAKYIDYLTFLLGKAGAGADARARAQRIFDLERGIATNDWDPAATRNPELTTTVVDRATLVALAPDLPLDTLIDESGFAGVQRFMVPRMPPTPAKLDEQKVSPAMRAKIGGGVPAQLALFRATPVEVWKDWMTTRFLSANSAILPSDIDEASFAFGSTYLFGIKTMPPRFERATNNTNASLGEAIGRIYVDREFPPASKAAMIDLVNNLRGAMESNLGEVKWMSPATRAAARVKLDALNVKIGYPEKFETYDSMVIKPGDALGNRTAALRWAREKTLRDYAAPVDKARWFMTPQTVNAYYAPALNEIVFPAAYLQAPNFSASADPAVNYAAIGSTIGHEIGHGFDDQGARYDAQGRLRDWWAPEDKAQFQKLGAQLVQQYAANCPFDDGKTCINGELTLGENIGDLSGLDIAYRAYKKSLNGAEAPVIDGLTGDQRFFIAYAQKYRNKWSEAFQRVIMESDPHAPDIARINEVLRNFDPWYAAFNVTPDDALYLPPSKRVKIW